MKAIVMSLTIVLLASGCTSLGSEPVYVEKGIAANGYDVVAYFTHNRAIEGQDIHQVTYNNARWQFANAEHQALFKANPEKYAPQYGGYCAYAMSDGFVVGTDPQAFTTHQDKLYLNFSLSVRENWQADKDQLIKEADVEWSKKISAL